METNSEKFAGVGADKPTKDVVTQYDKDHGTYKDATEGVPVEQRLPQANLPKGKDPQPMVLNTPGK